MTDIPTQDTAIQAIAMAVSTRILDQAVLAGDVGDMWADFPEIGENDWIRVSDAVEHVAKMLYPPACELDLAYATLAKRATND